MGQQNLSDDIPVRDGLIPDNDGGFESLAQKQDDGSYTLSVLTSGVHCAACIQKIESSLAADKDISSARLNFTTRRLTINWRGDAAKANAYVKTIQSLGYGVQPYDPAIEQEDTKVQERFLLLCLGVAGFAMGNVMLLSVGVWTTSAEMMGMATRDFMHWISALIALPTILFSGRPFFRSALKALSAGHTNMDVPISLALLLAGGMSLFETVHHGEHVYFDSAVMLIFFLLIGRYLDFRARKNARSTATDLLSTLTGFAHVIEGDRTRKVLIRDLKEDMIVRVAAGEKFPVDGIVIEGQSQVDTSLVTGETVPRDVIVGTEIYAGTMNIDAPVIVKVQKAADDSLLSDIVRLMEKAGQSQSRYVQLADRAARLYTPVVHSAAALSFIGWLFIGHLPWQDSLMIAVTVLIITCPCALGLAVPVVQVLASGYLLKRRILLKSGDALERLAAIDTIFFDKTGTLTRGHPVLTGVYDTEKLRLAASLADHSHHPLAQALRRAYGGEILKMQDVKENPGQGMEAVYNGQVIRLGSRNWCGDKGREASSDKLEIWLNMDGEPISVFHFEDTLRPDTVDVVKQLKALGLDPVLLSGDRESVVQSVSNACQIDTYYGEKTPLDKYDVLETYKKEGRHILMVGDGLNDTPVLAGAHVSMAPGTAIDMAQNAADIVFMDDNLAPVHTAYKTALLSQKLVKQNFALAVIYNVLVVPMAIAGFVTPLMAAIAMSCSSLIVIANSFRMRLQS